MRTFRRKWFHLETLKYHSFLTCGKIREVWDNTDIFPTGKTPYLQGTNSFITFLCFKECISLHLLQRADSLTAAVSARDSGHGRYFYFHATAMLRLSVSFKCNFEVNLEHCAAEWKQHALQPTTTTSLHHSSAVTDFFRQVCYTVFSTTATMSCKSLTQSSICGSIRK